MHPATVVIPPWVSWASNHPSTLAVADVGALVKVAGGRVMIVAVSVYVGIMLTGTTAPDIVVGGQGNDAVDDAGIVDVVAPVCHAEYDPLKVSLPEPREAHFPDTVRGSVGIQPLRYPNWYDQFGDSISPEDAGPI